MKFNDKVVLVTGSSRGIGKETAYKFACEGAIVIVHGPEMNDELAESHKDVADRSPKSMKVACELSDSGAIRSMFEDIADRFDRLDVLVNNAAAQNSTPFLEMEEDNWDKVMAVNLKAPFLCSQLAAKLMIQKKGGKIINVGSVHEYQTKRNYTHYSTSKGGLVMLTKNLALELAEHNIQVNQVAPGAIATALTDSSRQQQFLTAIPSGRVGKAQEIASMVCYLASDEADYITGISFTVDGGLTLGFCASRPDL